MRVRLLENVSWPHAGGTMHAHAPHEYDLPEDIARLAIDGGKAVSLEEFEADESPDELLESLAEEALASSYTTALEDEE